jgi:hypothetical protein
LSDTFGSNFNQVSPSPLEKISKNRIPSAPGWRCHSIHEALTPAPCQVDEFHFGSDLRTADSSKYKLKVRLLDDKNQGIIRKKRRIKSTYTGTLNRTMAIYAVGNSRLSQKK